MSVHFHPQERHAAPTSLIARIDALVGALLIVESLGEAPARGAPTVAADLERRYEACPSVARRRFDAVLTDATRTAATGVELLLRGCHPDAAALLAAELRGALQRLDALVAERV